LASTRLPGLVISRVKTYIKENQYSIHRQLLTMQIKKSLLLAASLFLSVTLPAEKALASGKYASEKLWLAGELSNSAVKTDAIHSPGVVGAGAITAFDVKPADVFRDYLKAIGGMEVLQQVKSLYVMSKVQLQGMDFDIEVKAMAPRLEAMTMSTQGNVVMRSKFDGTAGFTELSGNKTPLSEAEIKEKTVLTSLVEQLDYLKNPAFVAEVKGIEPVNGANAYKINITYPTGNTKSEFYDVKTKLLVKKEETKTEGFKTTTSSQVFTDYKMVGKINFPFTQTLTISSTEGEKQVLEMKATVVKINEGVTTADFK
jgi:zinc protease